jgi:hypothetical protein
VYNEAAFAEAHVQPKAGGVIGIGLPKQCQARNSEARDLVAHSHEATIMKEYDRMLVNAGGSTSLIQRDQPRPKLYLTDRLVQPTLGLAKVPVVLILKVIPQVAAVVDDVGLVHEIARGSSSQQEAERVNKDGLPCSALADLAMPRQTPGAGLRPPAARCYPAPALRDW